MKKAKEGGETSSIEVAGQGQSSVCLQSNAYSVIGRKRTGNDDNKPIRGQRSMQTCDPLQGKQMTKGNGFGESTTIKPVLPFLKWPGGKRWLVPTLKTIAPSEIRTYYEPFLGGGALFFALKPTRSVLSDINEDLIRTYRQVKYHPSDLVRRLQDLPVNKNTYDYQRKHVPRLVLDRAVRFLYLNRTAFGGMYRLNQTGEFNVPFGGGERTPAPLWESGLLRRASRALRSSKLEVCDFEDTIIRAGPGDLVYCDPTYTVTRNNGFIRYNEKNFTWADQKRLARCCQEAAARGATVIVSNACHHDVLELFDPPRHFIANRHSCLCPKVEFRCAAEEYVFVFPSDGVVALRNEELAK